MQERNIIQGITTVALTPLMDFYANLAPFLIFAVVLLLVDLRFGVAKARKRCEEIRLSRAIRRTFNKAIDYLCWVTLAGMFGYTFGDILGIPYTAAIILAIIYGIEINSCFSNYFEARGINKSFNVFKLLAHLFKKDIDLIEPKDIEPKDKTNKKNKKK